MRAEEFSVDVAGKRITATFSDLALAAHGSVMLRSGNTVVLATAVMADTGRPGTDFFPLTVDYEERFYATGHIPGSRYVRREGKPSDEAILSARAVDRAIRPLFDQRIRNDIQVVITVLSLGEDDPDTLAVLAASLALLTSDIPWSGPVSAVRIGAAADGAVTVNPTFAERESGLALDLLVCGKDGSVNMVEAAARELPDADIARALETALGHLRTIETFQRTIAQRLRREKRRVALPEIPSEMDDLFARAVSEKIIPAVFSGAGKHVIHELGDEWARAAARELPDAPKGAARELFARAVREALHREAVTARRRADGRALTAIRPLYAQAGGISPVLHGTGIFYRGSTHVLSVLTLGGPDDSLAVDSIEERGVKKRFMHHYNFPPFSAGETGRVGTPNRRMIGHGALVERALAAVLPPTDEFPYTVRVVSECLASNGSTSMASVCAASIALMDGGVPITNPVAGIAIGLMSHTGARVLLTDIQGPEDEYGDMDFKVAGTSAGVTALQLDVKVDGVPLAVITEALREASRARGEVLGVIASAIAGPRENISPNAPEIIAIAVAPDKIGAVIGPGGKTLRRIRNEAGAQDIQVEEDGTVYTIGASGSAERAAEAIRDLTREYAAGERYEGVVARIVPFGAFVRIGATREGLVHISDIAPFHIPRVEDALSVGERVPVIVKEVDGRGRLSLSIAAADAEFVRRKGLAPRREMYGK